MTSLKIVGASLLLSVFLASTAQASVFPMHHTAELEKATAYVSLEFNDQDTDSEELKSEINKSLLLLQKEYGCSMQNSVVVNLQKNLVGYFISNEISVKSVNIVWKDCK